MVEGGGRRGAFPTTRWSLIFAAQKQKPESSVMNTLCELYWYPVYAFIRRQGAGASDAEDLTQGFFASLLEKNSVLAADRDRGRFRNFLLGSLTHFLSHERERAAAQKRGGKTSIVSFDSAKAEDWYQQEPATGATPEQMFVRRWALQMLDTALEQLRSEYQQRGRLRHFEVLAPFLDTAGDRGYEQPAADLGKSVDAIRTAVHRFRTRFRTLLRELIGATVSDPNLIDDELRYLLEALSD